MPNQRARDKRQFSVVFTKEELAEVDALAEYYGMSRTAFLRQAAVEFCEKYRERGKKPPHNPDENKG